MNGTVGQRTVAKGFVDAPVIYNGEHDSDVGGGVSQFATTTFNAAFFGGLDFEEYQSHSLYISRYPYGREATVSWKQPDLKIKNVTPYGILIWPTYTGTSLTVTLYSTPWVTGEQTGQTERPQGACTKVSPSGPAPGPATATPMSIRCSPPTGRPRASSVERGPDMAHEMTADVPVTSDRSADDLEFEPRMSDADALMWNIEKDPLLRSTILTVMVFDRSLDRDRLHRRIDRVSRLIPRLRQRVRGHTLSIAPPRWDVDPNFDLHYHLRFMRAAGAGTHARAARHRRSRWPCRASTGPGRCGSSPSSRGSTATARR